PNAPGPVFSMVIPPPNVTGSLHIGHMLNHTEIDVLTRWHRMRGYNTLYLPGMDHAGISTQRVVVRQLAEQGIDYRKLGREEFERRVWKWKEESGGMILGQMRQIGESCDWSREKFTLSPELSRVVREVFVRLYEEGLIYRATQLVNWCPDCLTVLSDLEVAHEERQGHLWHIKYPIVGTKEFLTVATTRPETMLGDTAVAVHPEDERYKRVVGRKALLPLMNREIPIIADEMVDREIGGQKPSSTRILQEPNRIRNDADQPCALVCVRGVRVPVAEDQVALLEMGADLRDVGRTICEKQE